MHRFAALLAQISPEPSLAQSAAALQEAVEAAVLAPENKEGLRLYFPATAGQYDGRYDELAAGGWLCGAWGVWLSARLRFWEGPGGVRAMATVALATSLALLFVDAGQPDVRLFRIGLAAWGIGGAAAALMQGREDFQQ